MVSIGVSRLFVAFSRRPVHRRPRHGREVVRDMLGGADVRYTRAKRNSKERKGEMEQQKVKKKQSPSMRRQRAEINRGETSWTSVSFRPDGVPFVK